MMNDIIRQAVEEYRAEVFREAVEKYKEKLRNRKSVWDRLFPFRVIFVRKTDV